MKTHTAIETLDIVITHMRKQGTFSVSEHGCMYRDGEGNACAIGCLIPDELYSTALENRAFIMFSVDAPAVAKYLKHSHPALYNPPPPAMSLRSMTLGGALQYLHDRQGSFDDFLQKLEGIRKLMK